MGAVDTGADWVFGGFRKGWGGMGWRGGVGGWRGVGTELWLGAVLEGMGWDANETNEMSEEMTLKGCECCEGVWVLWVLWIRVRIGILVCAGSFVCAGRVGVMLKRLCMV